MARLAPATSPVSVRSLVLAGLLAVMAGAPLGAQDARVRARMRVPDSLHTQLVKLRDGSSLVGRFVAVDTTAGISTFESRVGTVTIPVADIVEVQEFPNPSLRAGGEIWLPNPNTTRLLFAPTGRMLKQGDGYFSVYELFFPGFAVGLTDRVSIGGGMSLIPGVEPAEQVFFFTPKVGLIAREEVQLAAGALIVRVPDDAGTFGLLYSVLSLGREDANVTFGAGYGYVDDRLADSPALMIGGIARMSSRTAIVTENYMIPGETDPLVSLGVRFFGEKLAVDFGLFNVIGEDAFWPGFPFIGFVSNF